MPDSTQDRFKIKNILYTCTLLATSIIPVHAYALANASDSALTAVIETVETVNGDYLPIRFTLKNTSSQTVKVLKWNTPLEDGFNANMFEVWREAEKIDYVGRYVKRDNPSSDDYINIQPGEAISKIIDLSEAYDVHEVGGYEIGFNSLMTVDTQGIKSTNSSLERHPPVTVASNEITAYMNHAKPVQKLKEVSASYQGCADLQVTAIKSALIEAEAMAYNASQIIKLTPEHERSRALRYKTWFGRYTEANYQAVNNNFESIYDVLINKKINFDCTCPAFAKPNSLYAYVMTNEPYNVYLCDVFWRVGPGGRDSKGGTIIHELSHFTNVADTNDYVYGHKDAKELARKSPNFAIKNAENHEYFAENTANASMGSVEVPVTISPLEPDQTISGSLVAGKWLYFEATGVESVDLYNLSGNAGLYVKAGSKPALFDFDCKPNQKGNTVETCGVDSAEKIFIGLYAPITIDHFTLKVSSQANALVYPKKGLWWNPQRDGSGFDIELSDNTLSVIWYTYDQKGHPVWYLASGLYSGHGWKADIKQHRQGATPTTVGVMQLDFPNPLEAKLSWTLDGFSGDETISFLDFSNGSSDHGYSGIWYPPANPGSGITFVEQGATSSAVLYFYDTEGNPRWALSKASQLIRSEPGDYSYQLETFIGGACPHCTNSVATPLQVGELVMNFSNTRQGIMDSHVTLKAPLTGSWNVNQSMIENLTP